MPLRGSQQDRPSAAPPPCPSRLGWSAPARPVPPVLRPPGSGGTGARPSRMAFVVTAPDSLLTHMGCCFYQDPNLTLPLVPRCKPLSIARPSRGRRRSPWFAHLIPPVTSHFSSLWFVVVRLSGLCKEGVASFARRESPVRRHSASRSKLIGDRGSQADRPYEVIEAACLASS